MTQSLFKMKRVPRFMQKCYINSKFDKKVKCLKLVQLTYALSFYRFQNVLCRFKFFEPAQKFDCIQCLLKTFVLAQKAILLNANHIFGWHKMYATDTICKEHFGPVQIFWDLQKYKASAFAFLREVILIPYLFLRPIITKSCPKFYLISKDSFNYMTL